MKQIERDLIEEIHSKRADTDENVKKNGADIVESHIKSYEQRFGKLSNERKDELQMVANNAVDDEIRSRVPFAWQTPVIINEVVDASSDIGSRLIILGNKYERPFHTLFNNPELAYKRYGSDAAVKTALREDPGYQKIIDDQVWSCFHNGLALGETKADKDYISHVVANMERVLNYHLPADIKRDLLASVERYADGEDITLPADKMTEFQSIASPQIR